MLFLKILQISQENACARVPSLLKLQALELYLKRDSGKGFTKFLVHLFYETHLVAISVYKKQYY